MSVDALKLERSTLERKDRTELATIAETLGQKPASRAKKSDIVDLILHLTGVAPQLDMAPFGEPAGEPVDDAAGSSTDTGAGGASPDAAASEPAGTAESQNADVLVVPRGVDADAVLADSARTAQRSPDESDAADAADSESGNEPGSADEPVEGDPAWTDGEGSNRRRRRRRGRGGERTEGTEEAPADPETFEVEGLLDLRDEGYGFLRVKGFVPSRDDVYVSVKQCRQLGLRRGDHLKGSCRPAGRQEKNPALLRVESVNGMDPELARRRPRFEELTPRYPDEPLRLESSANLTGRVIDLVSPIAKGQRSLIVAPPRAGRSEVLRSVAEAVEELHSDVQLIVVVVDERPEEVAELRAALSGEVIASTFDRSADEHTAVAELALERAKRLVEYGQDVVVVVDNLTRLARAYQHTAAHHARSGNLPIEPSALFAMKRFFGAGRAVVEGGSLAIIASVNSETGARLDEVVLDELAGSATAELWLGRDLTENEAVPSVRIADSFTRRELDQSDPAQTAQRAALRAAVLAAEAEQPLRPAIDHLAELLQKYPTNAALLAAQAVGSPQASPES